jgi:glycosyltransferase involved in cell wall biosynthesis
MVRAMEYCNGNIELKLAGEFSFPSLRDEVEKYDGWKKIEELGFIDRKSIEKLFSESIAGLVILKPIKNYLDSLPVKLFEYMAAELPVITSNFPIWKKIIEDNKCGICVDSGKPEEIALAIDFIANNREQSLKMGENGRKAVYEKYNWDIEEEKLLKIYENNNFA